MNRAAIAASGVVLIGAGAVWYIMRAGNIDILARTIWGEARGEDMRGRIAVANVVMARVADPRWPDTVRGVCLQPLQFSAWNIGNPNREQMLAVDNDDEIFVECVAIARSAIDGRLGDVTDGANHYLTRAALAGTSWDDNFTKTAEIGSHVFLLG